MKREVLNKLYNIVNIFFIVAPCILIFTPFRNRRTFI